MVQVWFSHLLEVEVLDRVDTRQLVAMGVSTGGIPAK